MHPAPVCNRTYNPFTAFLPRSIPDKSVWCTGIGTRTPTQRRLPKCVVQCVVLFEIASLKLTAPTRWPSVPKPNGRLVLSLAITRKELVYGSGLQCDRFRRPHPRAPEYVGELPRSGVSRAGAAPVYRRRR